MCLFQMICSRKCIQDLRLLCIEVSSISYYSVASNDDNSYNACMSKYLIFYVLYVMPFLF
jgi:hypothetical protein